MDSNTPVIVDMYEHRPHRIPVLRNGMRKWVEIEPNHPRFSMSMDEAIKRRLDTEERFLLADRLSAYFEDALSKWADEPIRYEDPALGLAFLLSDNPHAPGNMLVRLAR